MASGYNRVVMVGNLTRDPELKQLPSGQAVCRLNVASNRQFRNRQTGDMVQEVCYVDVDVWGPQAESSSKFLAKGRLVLIEGRLKLDTWQDGEGNNRSKHSIVADRVVFLSSGQQDVEQESSFEGTRSEGYSAAVQEPEKFEPRNEVERELMAQLDDIKKRTTPQPVAAQRSAAQSVNQVPFKDEPPFQDDLPF